MSIYADSSESFRMLARIVSKSIANPPWFALPISAQEDPESVTVSFHVPEEDPSQLRVEANDRSVTVLGGRDRETPSSVRLCSLPCPVVVDRIETTRTGDLLHVRMPKKCPALASRETSSAP